MPRAGRSDQVAESALGGSCVGRLGAAMRPAVAVRSPAKPSRAGVRLMAAARTPTGGDVGRDEANTPAQLGPVMG